LVTIVLTHFCPCFRVVAGAGELVQQQSAQPELGDDLRSAVFSLNQIAPGWLAAALPLLQLLCVLCAACILGCHVLLRSL
jgi:hypothetical protein